MDQQNIDPDILWTYKDLARFLRVSEDKVRHDVMDRKIPFIKIGRSVRFHKNQIAEFLKIKLDEPKVPVEKIVTKPIANTLLENTIRIQSMISHNGLPKNQLCISLLK